jgi:hypothetical protein
VNKLRHYTLLYARVLVYTFTYGEQAEILLLSKKKLQISISWTTVNFKTDSTQQLLKNIHHFCINLTEVPNIGLQIVYFCMPQESLLTLRFLFEGLSFNACLQKLSFLKVEMLSHLSFKSFTIVACVLYFLYTFPPNVSALCIIFLQILHIFSLARLWSSPIGLNSTDKLLE